jgi:hypothetical protein
VVLQGPLLAAHLASRSLSLYILCALVPPGALEMIERSNEPLLNGVRLLVLQACRQTFKAGRLRGTLAASRTKQHVAVSKCLCTTQCLCDSVCVRGWEQVSQVVSERLAGLRGFKQ